MVVSSEMNGLNLLRAPILEYIGDTAMYSCSSVEKREAAWGNLEVRFGKQTTTNCEFVWRGEGRVGSCYYNAGFILECDIPGLLQITI